MQHIRGMVLRHVRLCCCRQPGALTLSSSEASLYCISQKMCMSTKSTSSDQLTSRVIELVKKYDKIDVDKVKHVKIAYSLRAFFKTQIIL
jgi:hypothetical protein